MASEKVVAMIEEVKALTVLELSELVHALEEEFGVSAAAMAAPAAGAAAPLTPPPRSRSSRLSARSPVWVWLRPRLWSRVLPRP